MARNDSQREDLLREATALVERVELQLSGFDEPIVAGFRRDGAASFFCGADAVYQFNAASELRRAFVDGLLLKAEGGRLIALRRERSERETALVRRELDDAESALLLQRMQSWLEVLAAGLATGTAQIVGQFPAECNVAERVAAWLAARPTPIVIAQRPNAGSAIHP